MACTCHNCGRKYKVDILVSDDVWHRIRPHKNRPKYAGLLCGSCILSKIEQLGEYNSYTLVGNRNSGLTGKEK